MRLVLIRHGAAEDREAFAASGENDARRPLTKDGRRKMRRAAQGLAAEFPDLSVLGASPLVRATETAQIVASAYEGLKVTQVAALSPRKSPQSLLTWVQSRPTDGTIGLVGHEPDLGVFASWLLTGLQESFLVFKKGGACALDLDGEIKAGHAKLRWLLEPKQLRALRK